MAVASNIIKVTATPNPSGPGKSKLDKFEEDVLGRESATVRGERRATVTFGDPVEALGDKASGMTGESLSNQLEESLQRMLVQ